MDDDDERSRGDGRGGAPTRFPGSTDARPPNTRRAADPPAQLTPTQRNLVRALLAAICVAFAALIMLVSGNVIPRDPEATIASAVQTDVSRTPDALDDPTLSVPLVFGQAMRGECIRRCTEGRPDTDGVTAQQNLPPTSRPSTSRCTKMCDRFLPERFANSVRIVSPDVAAVAAHVVARCDRFAGENVRTQPMAEWQEQVRNFLGSLELGTDKLAPYSLTVLSENFTALERIRSSLGAPEGGDVASTELAQRMRFSLCLRENIVGTRLAVNRVATRSDILSERFYQLLESDLRGRHLELESELRGKIATSIANAILSEKLVTEPSDGAARSPGSGTDIGAQTDSTPNTSGGETALPSSGEER